MLTEHISTFISVAAVAVSGISVYFARQAMRQSNRPIVTAFVQETVADETFQITPFNLVVSNTGTRPAVHVQLHAKPEHIKSLLDPAAPAEIPDVIADNFSAKREIPVLRNGEELTTAFGMASSDGVTPSWVVRGKQIGIEITYQDLDGRKYRERLPLKVYVRSGFGGRHWKRSSSGG